MMMMMRTIIDLPAEDIDRLADLCRREGISRAEAIRRAIADYLRTRAAGAAGDAFGIWSDRAVDGVAYQDRLRREWGRRAR